MNIKLSEQLIKSINTIPVINLGGCKFYWEESDQPEKMSKLLTLRIRVPYKNFAIVNNTTKVIAKKSKKPEHLIKIKSDEISFK